MRIPKCVVLGFLIGLLMVGISHVSPDNLTGSTTSFAAQNPQCSVKVILKSIELDYNNHVGNEWYFYTAVNGVEKSVSRFTSDKEVFNGLFSNTNIHLRIKATAKEKDKYSDIGSQYKSLELVCPPNGKKETSLSINVKVTEDRGRYAGNSAVWKFYFRVIWRAEKQITEPKPKKEPSPKPEPSPQETPSINVCKTDCDYSSIQSAIDASTPGQTVEIRAGKYEENLLIDKNLTLKGSEQDKVTIQASRRGTPVVTIKNKRIEVLIKDLTVTEDRNGECPNEKKGLCLTSGLKLDGRSHLTLVDVVVRDIEYAGIMLSDFSQVSVEKCTIIGSSFAGVSLSNSAQVTLIECSISENGYGIHLSDNTQAIIKRNEIFANKKWGIFGDETFRGSVIHFGNKIYNNGEGNVSGI